MREGNNKMQDKIYRRNTQSGGTSKKKKDEKARKRNTIMNFRVSPTEKSLVDKRIALSGLSKSQFFIQSCMYQAIFVKGNIRTFDAIKASLADIKDVIMEDRTLENLTLEQMESLRLILELLNKIYGKDEDYGNKNI